MYGIGSAVSLAAAPLGLVSVVVNLLRLHGSHSLLHSWAMSLNQEVLPRLSSHKSTVMVFMQNYIVRSIAAIRPPHAGALEVSVLSGGFDDIAPDMVNQLRACHSYERLKTLLWVLAADTRLRWCLQLQLQSGGDIDAGTLMTIISSALNMDPSTDCAGRLFKHPQDKLKPPRPALTGR